MNIVNKLTLRQLLLNKKRTVVTIIGTVISAAMITAVATLGLSFLDMMQRESIATGGEWHVIYQGVNKAQLEAIKTDKETKTVMMSRELGYAYLEGGENDNKPYLFISEFNKEGFNNMPVKLVQGRLPEKPDELVVSEDIYQNAQVKYKLGDVLTLAIGQRHLIETSEEDITVELGQNYQIQRQENKVNEALSEDLSKTYTVVGIIKRPAWEYPWSPGYTALSWLDENTVTAQETFDAPVIVKHIDHKIFGRARTFANANGIQNLDFNYELLRYYGAIGNDGIRSTLFTLVAIIMAIIMIGSVSLIYNAFAISVSERSKYLGMLSSVGATKKQKRNSVFFEGAVIGAISIPVGIAAGYLGIGITYLFINPLIMDSLDTQTGFRVIVSPASLAASVLVSAVTILISTYIPAKRASNVSAIDAIRQSTDIKISRKQVKTSRLTRKIFGIEAELGLKNLKRYKGRYKATVFSLIISMVLFLTVSAFTDNLKKSLALTEEEINYDIQVSLDGDDNAKKDEIFKELQTLDYITEINRMKTFETKTWVKKEDIADYLKDGADTLLENGKYPYYPTVDVMDDVTLRSYAKEAGADFKALTDPEKAEAIVIDMTKYQDQVSGKFYEAKTVKARVGDAFDLSYEDPDTGEPYSLGQVKVNALTKVMPMGARNFGNVPGFRIIISQTTYDRILEKEPPLTKGTRTCAYIKSDDPLKLQEELEQLQNKYGISRLHIYNSYQSNRSGEQMTLLLSVFTYAFIILITAICIANIINTISTGISLRKREFAMLKSVGITPKGFNKMLNYESIFYGLKALLYGLPVSIGVMYLMHMVLRNAFSFAFTIPVTSLIVVIVAVFVIVGMAMFYSSRKVREENIIDALKQEIA